MMVEVWHDGKLDIRGRAHVQTDLLPSSGLLMTLPPAMIPPDANTVVVKPVDWP